MDYGVLAVVIDSGLSHAI